MAIDGRFMRIARTIVLLWTEPVLRKSVPVLLANYPTVTKRIAAHCSWRAAADLRGGVDLILGGCIGKWILHASENSSAVKIKKARTLRRNDEFGVIESFF
jgi:hypothetical protein